MKLTHICLTLAALTATAAANAADPKLALVYDAGGKFDRSFNQSASVGAERFKQATKINYLEATVSGEAQIEQVLRTLARKKMDLIVAIGFAHAQALQTVAKEFPTVKFALIEGSASGPNINSISFKQEEGSYLAGVAGAMASKTKKLGFIGGMDVPLMRSFACGYAQGGKSVDPKVEVVQNMVGTTMSAWADPAKGGALARAQFENGVDVVFAAAGGSGLGVLQAAKEKGRLAIGVDSNQNHLHPGTMLTSMLKRVDNAVYDSFMKVKEGKWTAGAANLGLKEGGVELVIDKDNRKLVTPEMEKRLEQARKDILDGKVKVVDYLVANKCPV